MISLLPPLPYLQIVLSMKKHQAIGTPQVVQAVAEAACAKPLEGQLPIFEV